MINIQKFVCNMLQENCYVASDDSKECVIVDCGAFYPEERKAIVEYIKDNGLKPVHLLATHAHMDHNFGNDTIYEEFGLKPEVFAADERILGQLKEQTKVFLGMQYDNFVPPTGKLLKVDDKITFGTHTLYILHTPGHTPGSVFFYCKEEGVAFSGDTLFRMSIGRTDLELGSYEDIMESLGRIAATLPDDTIVLPGHGPQTTIGEEKRMNPYMR